MFSFDLQCTKILKPRPTATLIVFPPIVQWSNSSYKVNFNQQTCSNPGTEVPVERALKDPAYSHLSI